MRLKSTIIRASDVVILVVTLIALLVLVGYSRPLVISPLDRFTTTNASVLFSFERGKGILLDDNSEFSSPEFINTEKDLIVTLQPGKYYWKAEGIIDSAVHTLTVLSLVDLQLKKNGEYYEVINTGNVVTNVSFYEDDLIVNTELLAIDSSLPVEGTGVEGREYVA